MKTNLKKVSIAYLTLWGLGRKNKIGVLASTLLSFFIIFINEFYRIELIAVIITILLIIFFTAFHYLHNDNDFNQENILINNLIGILFIFISPYYINEYYFFILSIIVYNIIYNNQLLINKISLIKSILKQKIFQTFITVFLSFIIIHIFASAWRIFPLIRLLLFKE